MNVCRTKLGRAGRVFRRISWLIHLGSCSMGRRRSRWPASVSTSLPSTRICTPVTAGRFDVSALTSAYTVRVSFIVPPG